MALDRNSPRKGVVLAAGFGERPRPLTLDTPKALLEIGGRPLISYTLDALWSSGVEDIAIVLGYQSEKIRQALAESDPPVTFLFNEDYEGGNALSVYAARSYVGDEPFVVCMADHAIDRGIVERLLADPQDDCILCVDPDAWHPSQINDATRVMVDDEGYVSTIGKQLELWNAIDTGVFKMTGDVFEAGEHLMARRGIQVGITDVVRFMGANGRPFMTCDVGGMFWADVDTLEDYQAVDSLLRDGYGDPL